MRRLDRRGKVIASIAAAVVVLGIAGAAVMAASGSEPGTTASPESPGQAGSVPVPDGMAPGGSAAVIDPSASTAAPPPAEASGPPAPLVNPFAGGLSGTPRPNGSGPSSVTMAPGFDGCDHAYGDPAQCVPWTFPASAKDKCAYLKQNGFDEPIPVRGQDRHGLDKNGDGKACGPGDA